MVLEDGVQFPMLTQVTLAQLVERLTFNQVVMGSSPICDKVLLKRHLLVESVLVSPDQIIHL